MPSYSEEQSKKHGILIVVSASFLFLAVLVLSKGWYEGWSLMRNISEIYLIQIDDQRVGSIAYTRIYTKYFLVLALASAAYGAALVLGALQSPFAAKKNELDR